MNQEAVGEADLKTFFIIGIFSISALLFWLKSHKQQRGLVLSFVLSVCLIFSQVLIQNNVRRGMRFNSKLPQYWHWQKILSKIYNETGWTYGDIAERVYYINHHFEQAPRLAFDMFGKENQRFAKNPKLTPDGYMVSIVDPKEPKNLEWMLKQGLHDDIRAGLQSGDIILGEYDPNESVLIAPYYVKNKQNLPQFFSNQGLGYTHLPEEALLRSLDFAAGVKIVDKNNFIFKWNDCPDHHYYCDTGVIAKITKNRPGVYEIDLKIIGMSLSQGSKWISPDWTQSWINPYVELTCDNKTTRMRIISSVGYNQKYLTPVSNPIYKLSNNSILAPLYRHFDFKCSGELAELSVGRESSEVERISEFVKFPEARLSVRF